MKLQKKNELDAEGNRVKGYARVIFNSPELLNN